MTNDYFPPVSIITRYLRAVTEDGLSQQSDGILYHVSTLPRYIYVLLPPTASTNADRERRMWLTLAYWAVYEVQIKLMEAFGHFVITAIKYRKLLSRPRGVECSRYMRHIHVEVIAGFIDDYPSIWRSDKDRPRR